MIHTVFSVAGFFCWFVGVFFLLLSRLLLAVWLWRKWKRNTSAFYSFICVADLAASV